MKKATLIVVLVGIVTLGFAGGATAQTPQPRIINVYTSTFENIQPPARYFDLVQGVSEFQPGQAARANFSLAAPRFFTVVEGSVTATIGSDTNVFSAGQKFSVTAGTPVVVSNLGTTRARIFFSAVVPAWDTGAQPVPGSAVPAAPSRILYLHRTAMYVPGPGNINIVHVVQDWEPGAKNSPHTMNHPHLISVHDGENLFRYLDGGSERYIEGQQAIMTVGRPGTMENPGATTSRLFVTWIQVPGTPLTSPFASPSTSVSPPSAGDGGLVGNSSTPLETIACLTVGAFVLSSTALAAMRRQRLL